MPLSFVNPYTGQAEETCSTSFAAQQQMAGNTGSAQTEAQYNQSKLLGELGVIKAKLAKGEIPNGTKVFAYESVTGSAKGYFVVKGGKLNQVYYLSGTRNEKEGYLEDAEAFVKGGKLKVSIPQSTSAKPKPEPVQVYFNQPGYVNKSDFTPGQIVAVSAAKDRYIKLGDEGKFELWVLGAEDKWSVQQSTGFLGFVMDDEVTWHKPDGSNSTPNATPKTDTPKAAPTTVASPTPTPAVNPGSASVGSMSHEDVSALFVKIKDDLAKEKGLNVKGANPALDVEVYEAIGAKIGYTATEVKAKIDAYKAAGNKLSALKKKVMAGTYKIPKTDNVGTKPQPTKATPAAPLVPPSTSLPPVDIKSSVVAASPDGQKQLVAQGDGYMLQQKHAVLKTWYDAKKYATIEAAKKADKSLLSKTKDPEPNGVPTTATPKLANEIKEDVKAKVAAEPAKVYTDEDVASAYIIAKDHIVATNTKGWTLYTKNDEFDLEIAAAVGLKTGLNPLQQKQAIANYLGSGKKLSVLKKQLIKQGTLKPQADTLKKSGAAKDAAAKSVDVNAKADAGYTPTPTPATGTPPKDTGKPAPKTVVNEAAEKGDISKITANNKAAIFNEFKKSGYESYLSSSSGQNYDAFVKVQAWATAQGKDYSLLQLIRVVDEYGAQKAGVDNGKLFEKKVATWLTSPEGTAYIKANEAKLAKAAEDAKKAAEIALAAKKLEANQPPLPADSSLFQEMTPSKALVFQEQMLAVKPFGPGEKTGLRHYTGSAYTEMNNYLRGRSSTIGEKSKKAIEQSSRGMRPSPEPMLLRRGTGFVQFGPGIDASTIWGITGKTFEDKGFLSTSAAGRAAFGGQVAMEIEAPAGTKGMWVDNFSQHPGENEWLLDKGTKMKVLNVRKEGGTFVVRLRVVND